MSQGRLFELLCLLLERGRMTAPQLAEHFEVSVRTIYRDIDALSAAGVPVYSTPGKGGGWSLLEGYTLHRAAFTEEEQQLLLTALRSLPGAPVRDGGDPVQAVRPVPAPGTGLASGGAVPMGSAGADNAKFRPAQGGHSVPPRPVLHLCGRLRPDHPPQRPPRPAGLQGPGLVPPGILPGAGGLPHLQAHPDAGAGAGPPFSAPLSPPIEAGEPPEGFCIPVRLRFSPALAYRVYDEFDEGCVTRGADGSLVVSVSFPEDPWLYGYLLSFGLGVEVLEPERLRKRLALLAGKMAAHHGNHDTGCQDNCDRMEPSQSQEESHMNHTFCQSCGMPIDDPALRGTERAARPASTTANTVIRREPLPER